MVDIDVDPETVSLIVPQNVEAPSEARTESVDLSQITDDVDIPRNFIIPEGTYLPADVQTEVTVHIDVQPAG